MKVLVVEDEKKIASFVRNGLEERGVVVDVCHRGDEGSELATTRCYDGIFLAALLLAKVRRRAYGGLGAILALGDEIDVRQELAA